MPRPIGGSVHRRPTTCTDNLGVMDDRGGASLSHRHVQRVEDQFGAQMVGHRPPHHPAAEHIEYDGQIQESRRSRDVGDIRDPQPVRGLGLEATLDEVRRGAPGGHDAWCAAPCDGSPRPSLPHASVYLRQTREPPFPSDPLAAHRRALSGQLRVNPGRSVCPSAAFVNRPHARAQRLVRGLACRALTGAPRVVPARGDSEDRASSRSERNFGGHRGDSKLGLIRSHEPVDLRGTVPRANQAVAFAKISRSSRSRRFSRRRRRSSSRSAVLGPSPRRPSSRSPCTTQLRIACAVGSNSRDNSSGLRPVSPEVRRPGTNKIMILGGD